ncbi:M48 family metalloprotease [Limibaculum sp. M0105]|uniref:M48 family metalloprotease n=1 Tax=Thermohalobaculum xanthum TaxID=2753746 RepID=A0A8J7MAA4_9RHOB|nr:M48 family metalloprotease [Thermohalobaculum xanthum]MBK0401108.1 M48 family metalloprotease [Thermohalobaculum xanthum]
MTLARLLRSAALALGASALVACQTTAGSGGFSGTSAPETSTVRSASEQRDGDSNHSKIVAQYGGEYRNAQVTSYVERVGRRVAAVSEQPNERWTFTVLDTPVVNAFATPGGYVYVTRGLLALAENEAQLAGVIGHEIGHVTAGHGGERQDRSTIAGLGLLLGAIGLSVMGADPALTRGALELGQVAAGGIVASYSRQDELEADHLGIRYLARAGYDPYAQAEFLDNLAASSALDARAAGKSYDANQVDFFASHPATGPRTRQAVDTARAEGAISGEGELGTDRYLAAINGMTYGQSPEQGIVEGTSFSHPVLGFAFDVPAGYRITNTPSAVVASGSGNTRIVFDGANDPGGALDNYIARQWAPQIAREVRTGQLQGLRQITINGLPAAQAVLPVQLQNGTYNALLVAVRLDGKLYRFTGLAPRGSNALDAMARSAQTFRRLSDAERRAIKARRIEIVTVGAGDTAESLGRRMAVDALPVERFRVLNGLSSGAQPARGEEVKLVR